MGLYEEDGKTYLLSPIGGEMLTGEQEYEGKYYLMDDQGVVQTGWHNNKYYQEDGTAATGWMTVDGSLRYFDETGNMKTGLFTVDDEEFYTEEDGSVQPGWKEEFYVCRDGLVIRITAGSISTAVRSMWVCIWPAPERTTSPLLTRKTVPWS